jgi:4-hydroxybenzoate polyprenyltransferase
MPVTGRLKRLTQNRGKQLRAYLQIVRFPAVFTAMADIVLGFVLAHRTLSPLSEFVALFAASSCLYLAGMALNDFFDREIDAKERPHRPIPSGRISPRAALTLGSALLALGLASACAAGIVSATIAGALAGLVLAYDGALKSTPAGPVAMGGCRALNVLLGASGAALAFWKSPQVGIAAAMGLYVAGITWFARREAVMSSRSQLVGATIVIHSGILFLLLFLPISGWPPSYRAGQAALLLVLAVAFIDFRLAPAVKDPTPSKVQAGVKQMLLAIALLDATMVYWASGDAMTAIGTALLIVPAATLGRFIFIT